MPLVWTEQEKEEYLELVDTFDVDYQHRPEMPIRTSQS